MILTVTLNAALDVTYEVAALRPHGSHRVLASHARAGGKGINVARVLSALGRPALVTGLVGGRRGELIRKDLRAARLRDELVDMGLDSRRTLTVVSHEDGDATVFNESGPQVDLTTWTEFTSRFDRFVRSARVVVLSGSLPPGLPSNAYAQLIRLSSRSGAATILDTSGPALLEALAAEPDVIKPNAAEMAEVTGWNDVIGGATELRALGAKAVVASAGPNGLLAVTPRGDLACRSPAAADRQSHRRWGRLRRRARRRSRRRRRLAGAGPRGRRPLGRGRALSRSR